MGRNRHGLAASRGSACSQIGPLAPWSDLMNPTLVHQQRLRAACLHHRGPYQQIGVTFARLEQIAEAAGLFDPPHS